MPPTLTAHDNAMRQKASRVLTITRDRGEQKRHNLRLHLAATPKSVPVFHIDAPGGRALEKARGGRRARWTLTSGLRALQR